MTIERIDYHCEGTIIAQFELTSGGQFVIPQDGKTMHLDGKKYRVKDHEYTVITTMGAGRVVVYLEKEPTA